MLPKLQQKYMSEVKMIKRDQRKALCQKKKLVTSKPWASPVMIDGQGSVDESVYLPRFTRRSCFWVIASHRETMERGIESFAVLTSVVRAE